VKPFGSNSQVIDVHAPSHTTWLTISQTTGAKLWEHVLLPS